MQGKKYPLIVAKVIPKYSHENHLQKNALTFMKVRETKHYYFHELTPTKEAKYRKANPQENISNGRLSDAESDTIKINNSFPHAYLYDPNCKIVQDLKELLIERKLKDFKDEPNV